MKKSFRFLAIRFAICCALFAFIAGAAACSCGEVNGIEFKSFAVSETQVTGTVGKDTWTFDLTKEILVKGKADYVVSTEKGGAPIEGKVVSLVSGENTFYIAVTVDGKKTDTEYFLKITKPKSTFAVTFDTDGGTEVETQYVEEGGTAVEQTSQKLGYEFDGWNFDFATPITSSVTLTASWKVNPEMEIFDFESKGLEYCIITALNDDSVSDVVIPDYVTGIGERAFYNFRDIQSVNIGEGVTEIGEEAFYNCKGIIELVIPATVQTVNKRAFKFCDSLKNLTVEDGVQSLGEEAFYYCDVLSEVTVGAKEIGERAFRDCKALETLTITSAAESVSKRAFEGCEALSEVLIGEGVTSFGDAVFCFCTSLESITLPDSLETVGEGLFMGCSALKSLTLPFVGSGRKNTLQTYQYPLGYAFGTISQVGTVGVEQSYYGESTAEKTTTVYYFPQTLESVTVNGGIILVGAFMNTSLKEVNFKKDVSRICAAFEDCEIGDINVFCNAFIATQAFEGCNITNLTVNGNVTLDGDAFKNSALKLVNVINAKEIRSGAFSGCSQLETVRLPFIGKSAQETDKNYFSYIFGSPNNQNNFNYVPASLKNVMFSNIECIAANAFQGCTGIENITLPDTLTEIAENAFLGCVSLIKVYYLGSINDWVAIDFGNDKSNPLSLNNDCELIIAATAVTEAVINTAEQISSFAFVNYGKLNSIVIGSSVTEIGYKALYNCTSLTSVTFEEESGWKVSVNSDMSNPTSLSSSNLSDTATAANYLKSTYCDCYWKRG